MASFPCYPNIRQRIRRYPLDAAAVFNEGAAVMLDAQGELTEAAVPPTVLVGFALHASGELPEAGAGLVALGTAESTFILQGDRAPLASDVGKDYGLEKDGDGDWIVDTGAVAGVVRVEKVYLTGGREQYEVSVIPSLYQLSQA